MLEVQDLAASNAEAGRSLIAYRWPNGVWCPRCGSDSVRECRSHQPPSKQPVYFACASCGTRFTVRDGYFLADSSLNFMTWFWALYLVKASSELEPATQASLIRQLGVGEKTARDMIRRIRNHTPDASGWARAGPMNPFRTQRKKTPRPLHVTSTSGPDEPSHRETNPPMSGLYPITNAKNHPRNHNVPDRGHHPPSRRENIRRTRLTVPEFFKIVAPNEQAAQRRLIKWRWPDGPRCPHCGSRDVQEERPQDEAAEIRFRCRSCSRPFTVRTDHFTAYPEGVSLQCWLLAMYLMVSEPRFRSEEQIAHFLGLDQLTTALVIHAIHLQMQAPDPPSPQGMLVPTPPPPESAERTFEADEALWPKHWNSPDGERFQQRLYTVLVLDRESRQVRIRVTRDRTALTMLRILLQSGVGPDSILYSDGLYVYRIAARWLLAKHSWVNHTICEYVSIDDPDVHINSAESCFAWMRQALRRIEISQENLARYAAHVEFMINRREVSVLDRLRELVSREHGSLTSERIRAERDRFASRPPGAIPQPLPLPSQETGISI